MKRKLASLSVDELKELYKNNQEFASKVYERAYEDSMFWQGETYKLVGADIFDYHNHYTSFYLTTPCHYGAKDGKSVAHKLDRDYLDEEGQKLYDKICELSDIWDNLTYDEQEEWNEKNGDLEEQADELCDKLAENLTHMFRLYEDITDEMIDDVLDNIDDYDYMGEWEEENGVVYETIVKAYK